MSTHSGESTLEVQVDHLSRRFLGVDLQVRREGTSWPARWRARLVTSKNERADYRVVAYGDSWSDAARALVDAVAAVDARSR